MRRILCAEGFCDPSWGGDTQTVLSAEVKNCEEVVLVAVGGGERRDDAGLETSVGKIGGYGASEGVVVGGDGGVAGSDRSPVSYEEVEEARREMFDFNGNGGLRSGRGVDVRGEKIDAGMEIRCKA